MSTTDQTEHAAKDLEICRGILHELPKRWRIEFLLAGKADWYPGSALGTDAQDAIETFLENYSPSMGTIVGIRVPDVMERVSPPS